MSAFKLNFLFPPRLLINVHILINQTNRFTTTATTTLMIINIMQKKYRGNQLIAIIPQGDGII